MLIGAQGAGVFCCYFRRYESCPVTPGHDWAGPRLLCRDQVRQRVRDLPVSPVRRALVAKGRARSRMTQPRHQLGHRGPR